MNTTLNRKIAIGAVYWKKVCAYNTDTNGVVHAIGNKATLDWKQSEMLMKAPIEQYKIKWSGNGSIGGSNVW